MTSGPLVELVSGDPGSCSMLGGALRRQAEALRDRRTAVWRSATGLAGWTGAGADGLTQRLRAQLVEIDELAGRLEDIAAALQAYAADLAHAKGEASGAMEYATRHGLQVDAAGEVRPRGGPVAVEVALGRRAALPLAQHQVDAVLGEAGAASARLRRRAATAVPALRRGAGRLTALDSSSR